MDMALLYTADSLTIDAALKKGLLVTDDTLATAIFISLFTDKLAGPDDELPATEDWRRGWWGDGLANKPGDQIGSPSHSHRRWRRRRKRRHSWWQ